MSKRLLLFKRFMFGNFEVKPETKKKGKIYAL